MKYHFLIFPPLQLVLFVCFKKNFTPCHLLSILRQKNVENHCCRKWATITVATIIFLFWIGCWSGILAVIIFMRYSRLYRPLYYLVDFEAMQELTMVLRGGLSPFWWQRTWVVSINCLWARAPSHLLWSCVQGRGNRLLDSDPGSMTVDQVLKLFELWFLISSVG